MRTLTARDFGYRSLVGLDEKRLEAVVAASADVLESHLWRLPLAIPKNRAKAAVLPVAVQLTKEPGNHGAFMGTSADTWVLAQGGLDGPRRLLVVNRDGKQLAELVSVAEAWPATQPEPRLHHGRRHPRRRPADPERPGHSAARLRPQAPRPCPGLGYGGPHAQTVRKSWGYLREQWAADQGFIVVLLDGRGTPNRGRAFERAIRGDFIGRPRRPSRWRAGARPAGAADGHEPGRHLRLVVRRRLLGDGRDAAARRLPGRRRRRAGGRRQDYDTHYTERYVGLPDAHPEAYAKSSVLTYAAKLSRPLLLIHGTADDNVYFMHSIKLADALLRAGIDFDFLPLAGFTHMVAEPSVVERENARILRFFRQHLGTPQPAD